MSKKQQQAVSTSGAIEKAELGLCWREDRLRTGFSKTVIRDFLVVQWVRLCISTAVDVGLTPDWGVRSHI